MSIRSLAIIVGLLILSVLGYFFLFQGKQVVAPVTPVAGTTASPAESNDADILVIEVAGQASGTVEILLRPDIAPKHVAQIKALARSGAYDGVAFHRVIDGFMAQTGDVQYGKVDGYNARMAGAGGSDLPDLPAEFSNIAYVEGIVGMARSSDPNSANSQFFIMFTEYPSLNGQYTVVGRVISGMDVVNAIKRGSSAANGSVAQDPDYMAKVTVKGDN